MPFAAYLTPPLTTVRIPMKQTGQRAMSLLLDRIRGAEVESRVNLPIELIVRESTVGHTAEKGNADE
jgi:LacI family transcriptional regulator